MATSRMNGVLQHLRSAVLLRDGAGRTDEQLLTDFISRRDEAALAVLVQRHAPMVWGVCRRVLDNHHDAEDAFQATFLVLVRKAASIASRELLANWLYGVAHQTAMKARATTGKRKVREKQVTEMPEPAVAEQDKWPDVQVLLDQELSRLLDKYRAIIILCDLEDKSRKEAAQLLGLPEGTVGSRLARARVMLAKRLAQRGVVVSGGALATMLTENVASAGVPNGVVSSTIKAASIYAAGPAAAAGVISVKVAVLTEGVLKAMLFTKLKSLVAVVLMLGFVATGATILTSHTAAGQDDKKPTAGKPMEPAAKQEKKEEAFTAWGKEVNGLQAGLGFRPGEQRAYRHGETVTLVVRLRNVGKMEVEFQYLNEFFKENLPIVTDADGKKLPGYKILYTPERHVPEEVSLAPGKEIELSSEQYQLMPTNERVKGHSGRFLPLWTGTGKVSVQYNRLFGNTSAGRIKVDPYLLDLTTGSLELEIKADPPEVKKDVPFRPDNVLRLRSPDNVPFRLRPDKPPEPTTIPMVGKGPVAPKTDVVVEAADLGKVFKANQARFDEQYTDKTFQVRGKVTQVFKTKRELASTDGEPDYVVDLESDSGLTVQFLVASKHRKALAELEVNKLATIRGFCYGVRGGSYTPTGVNDGEKSIRFYAVEIICGKSAGTTTITEKK